MSLSKEQEQSLWVEWKGSQDPNKMFQLMHSYQPLIHSTTNRYRAAGLPRSVLNAEGQRLAIDAIKTYDPKRGASLNTHIYNNLRNVNRLVYKNIQVGKIPEVRGMKIATYRNLKSNMEDRLGREPAIDEMADELGWSVAEADRMERELRVELTAAKIEGAPFYGQATTHANRELELMRYLYHELSGPDKVIFEHIFGYGGKSILTNKEIAQKLHTNEMAITRAKRRLSSKIRSYK